MQFMIIEHFRNGDAEPVYRVISSAEALARISPRL